MHSNTKNLRPRWQAYLSSCQPRHHGANEIYTQTQAGYGAASAILNAPAKLTFNLKNVPAGMKLLYAPDDMDELKKIPVKNGKNVLELPGGINYEFAFTTKDSFKDVPKMHFMEKVISGEIREMDIDFRNYTKIQTISCPKEVKQGEKIKIFVRVKNFGTAPVKIKLSACGENLTLEKSTGEVSVQPGKEMVIEFHGKTIRKNEPFVFMVYPADKPENITSVSGVSL